MWEDSNWRTKDSLHLRAKLGTQPKTKCLVVESWRGPGPLHTQANRVQLPELASLGMDPDS